MDFSRTLGFGTYGVAAGAWRWVAFAFLLVALAAAGLAVATPFEAGWTGLLLVIGIGLVAALFFNSIRPRRSLKSIEARLVAEAAVSANVAWVVTSADGSVLECNRAYRRLAGMKSEETPLPPEHALASESSAASLYRLTHSAAQRKTREETVTLSDGTELLAAVRPLRGGVSAWWFMPQLTATPELHGGDTSLSAAVSLFRDAPIGVAIADAAGKLIDANGTFTRFFGGPAIGRIFKDLVEPADKAGVAEALRLAAAGGEAQTAELKITGDTDRMAQLYARLLNSTDGKKLVLYLVDVSEQKALETRFAQSQKMQAVGQLAGGVAHDFNNLLTVIIGNCEFLLMRHPAGDPSFKEINEIHQNALRAAALVGQLLAFSRKQTLQPRVLMLRDVIGELALMLRRLLREGIELKLEHGADLWPVNADEAQLSNAIINLVVNARDAMPRGGTVTIATGNESVAQAAAFRSGMMPPGDYVCIEVRDTGIGIPKENLDKIFDPFFTTKPIGQGTGLGLATVYGIVKQTGGFITVDSEPGKGTAFRIFLPRHQADASVPLEPEQIQPRDITGEDTILLVEDEDAVRSFAARALRLRGYNVLEAPGGEEALELVRNHPGDIHLLITDVVMPNMDGPTLVRAVRPLKPDMGVIFMSGYAEEAFRRHDEKAEDLHFLPKPFGLKQLAAKVKDVLSGARAPNRAAASEP